MVIAVKIINTYPLYTCYHPSPLPTLPLSSPTSQVNVTLHCYSCSPHSVSYTASVTADLPERVTGLSEELLTVENGTVVTILAPWINTSIVIHRTESHLSLTLQVPEPLTREGEVAGLCSEGCLAGYEVEPDVVEFPEYECGENKMSVLVMCVNLGLTRPPVGTMLYSKLCSYDILLTHDLSLLSLYVALNQDALALSDETTPPITVPTTSKTPPTTPEPTSQMVSSVIIFSTTFPLSLSCDTPPSTTSQQLHITLAPIRRTPAPPPPSITTPTSASTTHTQHIAFNTPSSSPGSTSSVVSVAEIQLVVTAVLLVVCACMCVCMCVRGCRSRKSMTVKSESLSLSLSLSLSHHVSCKEHMTILERYAAI